MTLLLNLIQPAFLGLSLALQLYTLCFSLIEILAVAQISHALSQFSIFAYTVPPTWNTFPLPYHPSFHHTVSLFPLTYLFIFQPWLKCHLLLEAFPYSHPQFSWQHFVYSFIITLIMFCKHYFKSLSYKMWALIGKMVYSSLNLSLYLTQRRYWIHIS